MSESSNSAVGDTKIVLDTDDLSRAQSMETDLRNIITEYLKSDVSLGSTSILYKAPLNILVAVILYSSPLCPSCIRFLNITNICMILSYADQACCHRVNDISY